MDACGLAPWLDEAKALHGEIPNLTAELLRRGWKEEDLRKFLSDNWRRAFAECLPA